MNIKNFVGDGSWQVLQLPAGTEVGVTIQNRDNVASTVRLARDTSATLLVKAGTVLQFNVRTQHQSQLEVSAGSGVIEVLISEAL